ncbi:MAG: hypothetical protein HQK52_11165 [Oligoflexia bacterium]|nr:hypothetical protein [Oligoflexia bacterium]
MKYLGQLTTISLCTFFVLSNVHAMNEIILSDDVNLVNDKNFAGISYLYDVKHEYIFPQTSAVIDKNLNLSYRSGSGTKVILDRKFSSTHGRFKIDIDGVTHTISDGSGIEEFDIPSFDPNSADFIDVSIRSDDKSICAGKNFCAIVNSTKLILDDKALIDKFGEWKKESIIVAELIESRLQIWITVRSLNSVLSWDEKQFSILNKLAKDALEDKLIEVGLTLDSVLDKNGNFKDKAEMPSQWDDLYNLYPVDLPNITSFFTFSILAMKGRPSVSDGEEIINDMINEGTLAAIEENSKRKLIKSKIAGENLVKRAQKYSQDVNIELVNILKKVSEEIKR